LGKLGTTTRKAKAKDNHLKTLERIRQTEDYLLSMLLLWPDLAMSISFDIGIFTNRRHEVSEIIKQLNAGVKPDVVTISEAMGGDNLVELAYLAKNCPGHSNYAKYLDSLADMQADVAVYRSLQSATVEIANGKKASEVFSGVVNSALAKLSRKSPKVNYNMGEAMGLLSDDLEKMHTGKETGVVHSGIKKLDDVLGGFHPSNLIIVGARPAVGKTALAVSMALPMAKSGKRVGFISSEMSVLEIARRIMSAESGLAAWRLREGRIGVGEWAEVAESAARIASLGIRVNDKPQMRIGEVVMQCRAWDMDGGLDIVFVDYLTRIRPDKTLGNQNLDVGELAAQFKNLARMLGIPVVVLAQLNRDSAKRADKTPNMADLRDSGIIEQEADCILLLHREESEMGIENNYIIIDKNRHGQSGIDLSVEFDKKVMRWH
jgi:replicative DNA helicase